MACHQASKEIKKNTDINNISEQPAPSLIHFINPTAKDIIKSIDNYEIKVSMADSLSPDSIQFKLDGIRLGIIKNQKESLNWKFNHNKVGTRNLQVIAFFKNKANAYDQVQIRILPEKPQTYTYKVVKTYPHDKEAYTQGLIYIDGILYEGTGQEGKSSLRKETLNGEIINNLNLPADVFGEGITQFDDKLIQITWKSQVAFIYDKSTFKQILKLSYPMHEGWGITYNGKNLIMSDGSSTIYCLDKQDLTEISRLEVCDDQGDITELNELELIEGQIWANVYQTDIIVRIDPETGAILGKIDMSGLLSAADRAANTDVLNGIAYDKKTKKIFVTGKNWPKLFEVSIIQKQ